MHLRLASRGTHLPTGGTLWNLARRIRAAHERPPSEDSDAQRRRALMAPQDLRALTIWQPWASACFAGRGRKNIENRNWYTAYRGRLYIHAAQRADRAAPRSVWRLAGHEVPAGAIIGHVSLVACTRDSLSRWAEKGMWHWWFHEPVLLPEPVVCSGAQSLWPLPEELWNTLGVGE